jgi:translation initiation factor IF-2
MRRIHQLARKLKVDKMTLLKLLRSRGFEVQSASSQIDNISAEALLSEFANCPSAETEIVKI